MEKHILQPTEFKSINRENFSTSGDVRGINFIKLNPSDNTTILITDYIDPEYYADTANKILSYPYLNSEQLGYICESDIGNAVIRLQMPADEFCGDGLLSAATLVKWMNYTDSDDFFVQSSGMNELSECRVVQLNTNTYRSRASMPLEHQLTDYEIVCENHKVDGKLLVLPGISHFIITADGHNYSKNFIKALIRHVASDIKANAIGIIPYYVTADSIRIEPCIHVPKTGKLLFEQGCGSGSLALGIYFAYKNKKDIHMSIEQPGGVIDVEVNISIKYPEGQIKLKSSFLETDISITSEGKVYI